MENQPVYILTIVEKGATEVFNARVLAHFEFSNEGRAACEAAALATPHAGMEGPVSPHAYPIGRRIMMLNG